MWLRRMYCRVPAYGQLVYRKGTVRNGWFDRCDRYYSLMLKGERTKFFGSERFYLVLTENCLEEARSRGKINASCFDTNKLKVGYYSGTSSVTSTRSVSKQTFKCIMLKVFSYGRHGKVFEDVICLSERQFRRGLQRSKTHKDLVARRRWWHPAIKFLYKLFGKKKSS